MTVSGDIYSAIRPDAPHAHFDFGVGKLLLQNLSDEPWRDVRGECTNCIVGDPAYVDATNGDFHLTAGSAAIDATVEESVYGTFESLYGLNIRNGRPLGAGWDIGAFEFDPDGSSGTVFSDNFEADSGWTTNAGGADTATTGQWERGYPAGTFSGGTKQLGTTVSGVTSITSPPITLPASGTLTLSFQYYLAHGSNSSSADFFRARIVESSGTTTVFESLGATVNRNGAWTSASANLSSFAGQTVWIVFEAADNVGGSLLEAGVDDVAITQP